MLKKKDLCWSFFLMVFWCREKKSKKREKSARIMRGQKRGKIMKKNERKKAKICFFK